MSSPPAAALGVLLVAASIAWALLPVRPGVTDDAITAARWMTLTLAIVIGLVPHVAGGLAGKARAARIHVAVVGIAGAVGVELWFDGTWHPVASSVRTTLIALAAVWVARGLRGPAIDVRIRHVRVVGLGLATMVVAAVCAGALSVRSEFGPEAVVAHAVLALVWAVVGALSIVLGPRLVSPDRRLTSWSCFGLASGELAHAAAATVGQAWLLPASAMTAAVLLALSLGFVGDLSRTAAHNRSARHRAEIDEEHERDTRRGHERDHAHEVRNALLAVEGAALTLHRYRARLDDAQRDELADALSSGLHHLRSLLERRSGSAGLVPALQVARSRALLARAQGTRVNVEGDAVSAWCDEGHVVQIVDNLLHNVRRHGSLDGPARADIHVGSEGRWVTIRVTDQGPGIPARYRERVFEGGFQLDPERPGDGLGLHVARELARQQGGDLDVEAGPSGGASFVLALPRCVLPWPQSDDRAHDAAQARRVPVAETAARDERGLHVAG